MLSFHGDEAVKSKYLARVAAHRAADELVQGTTWTKGKGCAIGCTLENYDHSRYPIELGVPIELARLEDGIFEGLTSEEAQSWPERFLSAISVGRDLSLVWPRFALWMLRDLETKFASRAPKSAEACGAVAALYEQWIGGSKPSVEEWQKTRRAAAAAYAAYDYIGAAAAYAAYAAGAYADAAYAAAYAAAYGADDAAAAYAAYAAGYAAYAAGADAYDAYDAAGADAYAAAYAAYDAARRNACRKFWTDAAGKLEELLQAA